MFWKRIWPVEVEHDLRGHFAIKICSFRLADENLKLIGNKRALINGNLVATFDIISECTMVNSG